MRPWAADNAIMILLTLPSASSNNPAKGGRVISVSLRLCGVSAGVVQRNALLPHGAGRRDTVRADATRASTSSPSRHLPKEDTCVGGSSQAGDAAAVRWQVAVNGLARITSVLTSGRPRHGTRLRAGPDRRVPEGNASARRKGSPNEQCSRWPHCWQGCSTGMSHRFPMMELRPG